MKTNPKRESLIAAIIACSVTANGDVTKISAMLFDEGYDVSERKVNQILSKTVNAGAKK